MRLPAAIVIALLVGLLGMPATGVASEDTSEGEMAEGNALERVRAYVQPAVVYVGIQFTGYVYDRHNRRYLGDGGGSAFQAVGGCTGFVVNPDGYIATAGHCVDADEQGEELIKIKAAEWAIANGYYANPSVTVQQILESGTYIVTDRDGDRKPPEIEVKVGWGVSAAGVDSGVAHNARVVAYKSFEESDAALLKIEQENLHAVRLADTEIEVGQQIVAIGYPAAVDLVTDVTYAPSYKDGTVSSEKTREGGLYKVFEVSAAVSGGMSGGPVANPRGQVVGFNSFGINPQIESQAFNFSRPVSAIQELLAGAGVENEIGPIAEQYNAGLAAYFAGDKKAAVENLEGVLDRQSNHELAQDFLDKARELEDPFPWALVLGIIGVVLFLLLILLVVLIVVLRARSKRKRAAAQSPAYAYAQVPQQSALPPAGGGGPSYGAPQQPPAPPQPQAPPPQPPAPPQQPPPPQPPAPPQQQSPAPPQQPPPPQQPGYGDQPPQQPPPGY